MDALKRRRRALRISFTRALTAFSKKLESDCSIEVKIVAFQFLETKMTELDAVHSAYNDALFESGANETEINKELESNDEYKTEYLKAKMEISKIMPSNDVTRTVLTLPKFELPKFGGNIIDWLPFWSQFKKINDDPSISEEDKMQYLQQAMIPDSRASELVRSFLPTGENYGKAISSLKNRFGRDDIIVEFYVRELLGLVFQNAAKGNERLSLTSLYDKLECYIRILETLGATMNNSVAMLYPLVVLALPEEVLRAWQCSGQRETTDRLANLLRFLQLEVESQELVDMTLTSLNLSTEEEKMKKLKGKTESKE